MLASCSSVLGASVSQAPRSSGYPSSRDLIASPSVPLQIVLDDISSSARNVSTLFLAPGTHSIRQPLQITRAHSGLHVIGLPNSKISGGVIVSGWRRATFHPNLLQADVGSILKGVKSWPRNLWVGGRRAERAALTGDLWKPWTTSAYQATADGYLVHSLTPLLWRHPSSVEMLYTAQGSPWTESRCTVASVEPLQSRWNQTSVLVRMKQPCWFNLVHKPCGQGTSRVVKIENAGILSQVQAGEWYLDWGSKLLFYAPLPGERVEDLEAVLPISEGLLHASPGVAALTLINVTFMYDAWAQPNGGTDAVAPLPHKSAPSAELITLSSTATSFHPLLAAPLMHQVRATSSSRAVRSYAAGARHRLSRRPHATHAGSGRLPTALSTLRHPATSPLSAARLRTSGAHRQSR